MVVAQQAENLHNGRVALAKGQISAVVLLAVLDVQGDDLLVVLANIGNGITAGGYEVANVQVDADVG